VPQLRRFLANWLAMQWHARDEIVVALVGPDPIEMALAATAIRIPRADQSKVGEYLVQLTALAFGLSIRIVQDDDVNDKASVLPPVGAANGELVWLVYTERDGRGVGTSSPPSRSGTAPTCSPCFWGRPPSGYAGLVRPGHPVPSPRRTGGRWSGTGTPGRKRTS